jgi:hypothetical protein
MNEAETCAEHIDPALKASGWDVNASVPSIYTSGAKYGLIIRSPGNKALKRGDNSGFSRLTPVFRHRRQLIVRK